MIFAYIAKTVLKKWITTLSQGSFSTHLVSHQTQVFLSSNTKKVPADKPPCQVK
jgi:hypothetical protein